MSTIIITIATIAATKTTKKHGWIQRITFAAETNAADTHMRCDSVTDGRRATQYLLRSLLAYKTEIIVQININIM